MAEQGRAARDVIKAAQNTTNVANQLRKATGEQANGLAEISKAVEQIRSAGRFHGQGRCRAGHRYRSSHEGSSTLDPVDRRRNALDE